MLLILIRKTDILINLLILKKIIYLIVLLLNCLIDINGWQKLTQLSLTSQSWIVSNFCKLISVLTMQIILLIMLFLRDKSCIIKKFLCKCLIFSLDSFIFSSSYLDIQRLRTNGKWFRLKKQRIWIFRTGRNGYTSKLGKWYIFC